MDDRKNRPEYWNMDNRRKPMSEREDLLRFSMFCLLLVTVVSAVYLLR